MLQMKGCNPRWPLCLECKHAPIPPFISSVSASFRSKEIHTLAVGCVKSHFLFADIKCCCVTVLLDLASDVALLTGRTVLVPA